MTSNDYKQEQEVELAIFNQLYRTNVSSLMGYARRFVSAELAEDLVHDVFVKVWTLRSFHTSESGFRSYLFRCVLNACLDHFKHLNVEANFASKAALEMKREELNYHDANLDEVLDNEQLSAVYREIDNLPEKCAEIFRLFYLENEKSGEIALKLNISQRTVESQIYKALRTIRKSLRLFLCI